MSTDRERGLLEQFRSQAQQLNRCKREVDRMGRQLNDLRQKGSKGGLSLKKREARILERERRVETELEKQAARHGEILADEVAKARRQATEDARAALEAIGDAVVCRCGNIRSASYPQCFVCKSSETIPL